MVVRTIIPPTPSVLTVDIASEGSSATGGDSTMGNDNGIVNESTGVETVSIQAAPASPRAARGSITNSVNGSVVMSPEIHLDVMSTSNNGHGTPLTVPHRGSFIASVNGISLLNPSSNTPPNDGAMLSPIAVAMSPQSNSSNGGGGGGTLPSSGSSSSPRGSGILLAALTMSSSTNHLSTPPSPPSPPLHVAANLPPMPPAPLTNNGSNGNGPNVVMIHRGSI
jgi:hypothetical protein